jgi:hypothetical protein
MKGLRSAVSLCAVGALLAVAPAGAVGLKKLKQPKAFPITISTPGSYILTSNLDVTKTGQPNPENLTAIAVQADNVTIDLNGFSVLGPCTGGPPCSPTGSGVGIDSVTAGRHNAVVLNGTVQGMGSNGIALVSGHVDGVSALSNGDTGISANTASTVTNSTANFNSGAGIYALGGNVSGCTANSNSTNGIFAGNVSGSTAQSNTVGIDATLVTGCTAYLNTNAGIVASMAIGCRAFSNTNSQIGAAQGIAGLNICGTPGIPCP